MSEKELAALADDLGWMVDEDGELVRVDHLGFCDGCEDCAPLREALK